jgi:gliding motility-associated-like protein
MKLIPYRFALKFCSLALSIFTIFTDVLGQSLIINEVSQGPSGSKEYVEFLVVPGSGPYQCSNYCIDLRGWIIDDNNGYFSGGGGSGIGIAAGAVRFSNDSFWQCIPIGTIILVYNNQDLNVAIPPIDNSITDGNCKLVLPISSTLFENQTVSPSTTSSSYPTMGWLSGGLWGPISMANGGDSFQVYEPNNLQIPVHGVSWVNNSVNNIIYFATSSTNSVYYFANILNNNPSNQANWVAGTCSAPDNQTPGAPNNAANASYIQGLTNNCAGPLVATLTSSVDAGSCQCNGSATVSASGSIPQYSYNWYNSSNVSINQTTPTATNLCSGSYYCVVSSSINCTDTVLVTINSNVNSLTPSFNPIAPICSGGSFNLPSTSTNGITGSWSPAVNNTVTTTYTFTPDPNQCASSTSLTVQVSNTNTPTFNPIAPICIGGTINLQSTSTNGITGSWSPPVNNTSTTTYTFTPDPNQCASSTSITVQVSNANTPTFNPISPICFGGSFNLPTTSTNGITGSWSPAVNNTITTTYTFTPDPNQCASSTSLTVQVSNANTPTFNPISPICSGGSFNLPSTSTNGITGSWSPALNNTVTTTYTFTPSGGQCANSTSLTVQVLNTITPTFNQLGPFCQGATAPAFSNTSLEGITGVWGPPGINTGAVGTNTYVFVSNPGQCATNQSMAITVNPYLTPIFPVQDPICFGDNLVLPTLSTNGINGSWSPAFNNTNTTTYTFTPAIGQCAANTTLTVEILSLPPIDAGNNITICEDSFIQLGATGGIQYSWSGGIQNNLPFQPSQTAVYYVIGTDVNGCEAIDSVAVVLIPIPNAQFSADVNSGTAPLAVNFTNSSSNSTNYNWNFGDGNENSSLDLSNVSNTFSIPGEYTVWLVASNGFCSDSIMTVINVLSAGAPEIEIPNVFTPNGDNTNEEWIIQTTNIASIEVIILNRWGNVMAEINDLATGWNGKNTIGEEATDGTYFYKYTAKALNGENLTGHGFLTLIR